MWNDQMSPEEDDLAICRGEASPPRKRTVYQFMVENSMQLIRLWQKYHLRFGEVANMSA
jgi:hypothetical protein